MMFQRGGLLILILFTAWKGQAQQQQLDSLLQLEKTYLREDTIRAKLLTDLARKYYSIDPNIGIRFAEKGILICEKLPDKKFLSSALSAMCTWS
jgi:hypothetical protein